MYTLNNSFTFSGETLVYDGFELYKPEDSLPPYTMRIRLKDGATPGWLSRGSLTQINISPNIWDYTYNNPTWDFTLSNQPDMIEVISANIVGVTSLNYAFRRCTALSSVNYFDTSTVQGMGSMFSDCFNISSLPLLDTSKVSYWEDFCNFCYNLTSIPPFEVYSSLGNVMGAFYGCNKVQSGQYNLYRKMAAANPLYYADTFYDCGVDSPQGSAELAKIPASWK